MTCPGTRGTLLEKPCGPSCTFKNEPKPWPVPCYAQGEREQATFGSNMSRLQGSSAHSSTGPCGPARPAAIPTSPRGRRRYRWQSANLVGKKERIPTSIEAYMALQNSCESFALLGGRPAKVHGPGRVASPVPILASGITKRCQVGP